MRELIVIIFFGLVVFEGHSQQLPVYSQYTDNFFIVNPAIAGNEGMTVMNLTNRLQWVGLKDAPRTSSFSIQGRLLKGKFQLKDKLFSKKTGTKDKYVPKRTGRVGVGGYIFNDKNGLFGRTGFQFSYAYHLYLGGTQEISFGLAFTAFQLRLDRDRLVAEHMDDPVLYYDWLRVSFVPDANVGIYYKNKDFFAGLSGLNLSQSFLNMGNKGLTDYELLRHYYFFMGYNYNLNADYKIIPSALFRSTENIHRFQADFTCRVIYQEFLWGGVSYRTNNDWVGILGVCYDRFYFTYCFDYPQDPIRQHSWGSHELSITIKLGSTARKFRWLDRY